MRARKYILVLLFLSGAMSIAAQTNESGTPSKAQSTPQHHLMPVPASVIFDAGRLPVTSSFTVGVRGRTDERLQAAINRMMKRLEGRTVMEFQRAPASDASTATLVIEAQGPGQAVPSLDE
ncbi:MAG TPA: hypothetical protein VEV81_09120, partial [Pyrinomonadaceae bacterium]|nr:hypothetical protein [Pyrinomonadaceae bacterium]